MNAIKTLLFTIAVLFFPTLAQGKPLDIDVFTSNGGGFHATSVIVKGEKEAVLIDAQFTRSAAHRLTAQLLESGRTLTTVLITHAHPDHYFGLEIVKAQFPNVRILALPEVVEQMKVMGPEKVATWKPMYGDNLTDSPILPEKLEGDTVQLEGEEIRLLALEPGEIEHSTVFYVPSARTVIAGDLAYNGVHVWLAEADAARRQGWLRNLARIKALNPLRVVAGHQTPGADLGPEVLDFTATYIKDFNAVVASTKTAEAAIARMQAKYPDLALPIILELAAKAAYGETTTH